MGRGLTGNSYALPTKGYKIETLNITEITKYVDEFLAFAGGNPDLEFQVTKIGCGLAGYKEEQIAPLFVNAPSNCHLPDGWLRKIDNDNENSLNAMFRPGAPF
mgnify:CR=1 FL=1